MANIIDILMAKIGTVTVDTAAAEVQLASDAGNYFKTPNDNFIFDEADNCNVLSIWITYPYCFVAGTIQPYLGIIGREVNVPNAEFNVQLGTEKAVWIPCENTEIEVPSFTPWSLSPNGIDWGFVSDESGGTFSMFNVPDALDEEELDVYAFIKIRHNLPLLGT